MVYPNWLCFLVYNDYVVWWSLKEKNPGRSKSSTVRVVGIWSKTLLLVSILLTHSLLPNFHRFQDIYFVHLMLTSTAHILFLSSYIHKFCFIWERGRERMLHKQILSALLQLFSKGKIPSLIQCCSFNTTIQLFLCRIWYIPKEIFVLLSPSSRYVNSTNENVIFLDCNEKLNTGKKKFYPL